MPSDPIASRRFRRIRHRRAVAYRAGPGLDDALAVCRRLATYGLASTIGYSASRGESAREVAGVHMGAFEALAADGLDAYVSVKLPALDFDARLFAELASAAAQSGRRLHLDALAPSTADVTWLLLETEKKLLGRMIEMLPPVDLFRMSFSPSLTNWLPFYWAGFEATVRYTLPHRRSLRSRPRSQRVPGPRPAMGSGRRRTSFRSTPTIRSIQSCA